MNPPSNRGAVLLYVVVLAAVLASALALLHMQNRAFFKNTAAILRDGEARTMAHSPLLLAARLLQEDAKNTTSDGAGDNWYRFAKAQEFPTDSGSIALQISDAGALPNLNELFSGTNREDAFLEALGRYARKLSVSKAFWPAVKDWIDPNNKPSGFGGREYSSISGLPAPNRPLVMLDELRLVDGYQNAGVRALQGNVSLLPERVSVNVNTVHPDFLEALFRGQTTANASDTGSGLSISRVVGVREKTPYHALGDFYKDLGVDTPTKAVEFGTLSTYFSVVARVVETRGATRKIEALFERDKGTVYLRSMIWR